MYRLSTFEYENSSLLVHAIHNRNVYVFSYLIQFLKTHVQNGTIDLFLLLDKSFEICTSSSHHRIPLIIVEIMIETETINAHIHYIHEMMFKIMNIEFIKFMMSTIYFDPAYICEDGDNTFTKIVGIQNEMLVQTMFTKYNASLDSCDKNGVMLVIRSVEDDAPHISSLFIQRKCSLNGRNGDGKSLLELCIERKWYLHVTYILGNGYSELYDDENYFFKMCHYAVISNSTLIFDRLLKNYHAAKIQRYWRASRGESTLDTNRIK